MRMLVGVERLRLALADGAESAAARANVARDHKSRGAVRPAFVYVRAARLLADGVQVEFVERSPHFQEVLTHVEPDFQPARFGHSLCRFVHAPYFNLPWGLAQIPCHPLGRRKIPGLQFRRAALSSPALDRVDELLTACNRSPKRTI